MRTETELLRDEAKYMVGYRREKDFCVDRLSKRLEDGPAMPTEGGAARPLSIGSTCSWVRFSATNRT